MAKHGFKIGSAILGVSESSAARFDDDQAATLRRVVTSFQEEMPFAAEGKIANYVATLFPGRSVRALNNTLKRSMICYTQRVTYA